MTDITPESSRGRRSQPSADVAQRRADVDVEGREQLVACAELLFFAYRDFTRDPDQVLSDYGFGRAHHRVLHFVHRHPGLRVAQLLDILKITKQSLARVLKQLKAQGFISQQVGPDDGRERLLTVTPKGARLTERLTTLQIQRIESALAKAGPGADTAARKFLFAMIAENDRPRVETLIGKGEPHPAEEVKHK
jgi:DNA-binding MarR family transcriptional regulator